MYSNYNKYHVLQALFDRPTTGLHLREIAREAKLAPYSTKKYLAELEEEGLIQNKKERYNYPLYYANTDNSTYKLLRQQNVVLRLEKTGLLDELYDEQGATCIILFGSASRGEDNEESDIDLYIEGTPPSTILHPYEQQLRRKINIIFSETFGELGEALKNTLLNAVIIRGYVEAFNDTNQEKQSRHGENEKPRLKRGNNSSQALKDRRK